MTLYTLVNILKSVALSQPNVRMATDGSIYDKLNATNSVKYDVVHFSQTKHIEDEETDTYGFNIFYVSRLEDSLEDNRLQIQSIGKEVLGNILRSFCENWSIDFPEIIYYPFTQKFADLCAGVYCRVEIEVPKEIVCADDYIDEITPSKGIKLENILVEIDQNGTREVTPSPGFDGIGKVTIVTDVTGGSCDLEYKEVEYTQNGEYTVRPSIGYDGLSEVAVSISVPQGQGYEEGYADGVADQKAKLTVTSLTENNTYTREDGWSAVTVDVPSDYQDGYDDGVADQKAKLSTTSVTENGTYTREDGYSAITVNVDDRYDEGYEDGEAAQKAKLSATAFTDNGTYTNADGWSSVTVDSPWRDYFITGITLNLNSTITDIGTATTTFSPSSAFTDIYYTSSDPTIADIDSETGVITAKTDGQVTICTIDRITHIQDCKQVSVTRSSGLVMDVIYNVTSTTEPTVILSPGLPNPGPGGIVAGRLDDDTPIPISTQYPYTTTFTFPTTGLVRVHYTVIGNTLRSQFSGVYTLVSATIPEGITKIYGHLFDGDYQLTDVTLPSTLSGLLLCFMNCTALTGITIPSGVTTLAADCFYNCKSLSSVTIPSGITEIKDSCFGYRNDEDVSITAMTFEGTVPPILHTTDRGYGTPSLGKYTYTFPIYVPCQSLDAYKTAPIWEEYAPRIQCKPADYLTFNIISGGTINWKTSNGSSKTIQYSLDYGGNWTSITSTESGSTFNVNAGDKVMFKGDNATYNGSVFCGTTAIFEVEGNIMSLIDSTGYTTATTLTSPDTFTNIFYNCSGLTSAENLVLPATTLASQCYAGMFSNCSSLTSAPELPATTLASGCYSTMFSGCTSLTAAPVLPATTLANLCYNIMFYGCTNLNYIKCLATDISAILCTNGWVYGIAATGTFVKNPSMSSWPMGEDGIPTGWTIIDNS